jgi:hypothetical protein
MPASDAMGREVLIYYVVFVNVPMRLGAAERREPLFIRPFFD